MCPRFRALTEYVRLPDDEMRRRAAEFLAEMQRRRTVREFSPQPVPDEVVEACVRAAATAPSGANMQPWHFVVVRDAATRREIRLATEAEERRFYRERAPQEWLDALAPLGTDEHKPFLETAPLLIAVFAERYGLRPGGARVKHYYVAESVGIATGILITALHHAGLGVLTHTPSPMRFLARILGRPDNQQAYLLVVAGYPAPNARVPVISRKRPEDVISFR